MSNIIHQPNDKFFKKSMGDIRVARDFFQQHLPEDIKKLIDFEQLSFHKNSYIDEDFKASEADVVYGASFQSQPGYLYILLENQAVVDTLMPYRLIKYMFRIMDQHLQQTEDKVLPIVYPIVFFSGTTEYTASLDIFSLFGQHQSLAKKIFLSPFHLIDAKKIDDAELRQHFWAGVMEFIYKYRALGDVLVVAEPLIEWLGLVERRGGYEYAEHMLKYVMSEGEGKPKGVEIFMKLANDRLSNRLRGEIMTFAEQLEQRGRQEERNKIIPALLAEGMSLEKIAQIMQLPIAEIAVYNK